MMLIPDVRMAKNLAQRPVLVHHFVEIVEIASQPLFDNDYHKDMPHLYPRAPNRLNNSRKNVLLHQSE